MSSVFSSVFATGFRDVPTEITLEGRFFGRGDDMVTSVVLTSGDGGAGLECGDVTRVTEHLVTCVVPPGPSGNYNVTVRVGEDEVVSVGSFTIDFASIQYVKTSPMYYPFWTDSRLSITVETVGLSTNGNTLGVEVGDVVCRNVTTDVVGSGEWFFFFFFFFSLQLLLSSFFSFFFFFSLPLLLSSFFFFFHYFSLSFSSGDDNDLLIDEHTAITTRTLSCILPSDRRGPQGLQDLVVFLRDDAGDDVLMNATQVEIGQPRFVVQNNAQGLAPTYGDTVISLRYFEESGVVDSAELLAAIEQVTVGGLPCAGVQVDSALTTLSCSLPRHATGPAGIMVSAFIFLFLSFKISLSFC